MSRLNGQNNPTNKQMNEASRIIDATTRCGVKNASFILDQLDIIETSLRDKNPSCKKTKKARKKLLGIKKDLGMFYYVIFSAPDKSEEEIILEAVFAVLKTVYKEASSSRRMKDTYLECGKYMIDTMAANFAPNN